MEENFSLLEEKINYQFKNKKLLKCALTHKTYAFEASMPLEYNERLEFLGDSILNFIIAEQLYKTNKFFSEGELTRRRSIIVNNNFLANKARNLGLGKFLLLENICSSGLPYIDLFPIRRKANLTWNKTSLRKKD